MSPPLGRVQAALARREGGAPGMAGDGARGVSRRGVIGAARGDTQIATPGAIAWLSASWAFAGGRGGGDRRGRSGSPRAQRARQGDDRGLQLPTLGALRRLRALAIAARIAPGREHEGRRGRRLRGEERVFFLVVRPPPKSPLFPYTTLFR